MSKSYISGLPMDAKDDILIAAKYFSDLGINR